MLREIFIDKFGGGVRERETINAQSSSSQVTLNRENQAPRAPKALVLLSNFPIAFPLAHSPMGHPVPRGNVLKLTASPNSQGSTAWLPLVSPDYPGHDRALTLSNQKDPPRDILTNTKKFSIPVERSPATS